MTGNYLTYSQELSFLESVVFLWLSELASVQCRVKSKSFLLCIEIKILQLWNANIHVLVNPLASSLVLESCLGEIYGKHTGNTHQSSNSTIDELGREACEKQKSK